MKRFLGLTFFAVSITSFAADNNLSGAYIGLNAGVATTSQLDNSNGGVSLDAGYAFNKYLAVEGDIAYLGGETATSSSGIASASATGTTSFLTANVRGTLPLTDLFSLYGKLGAGINYATLNATANVLGINASVSDTSINPAGLVGVGAEFNLSKHWALKVEDDYYLTKSDYTNANSFGFGNSNFFNIGGEFRF